jgi:hypothetical protein
LQGTPRIFFLTLFPYSFHNATLLISFPFFHYRHLDSDVVITGEWCHEVLEDYIQPQPQPEIKEGENKINKNVYASLVLMKVVMYQ